MSAHSSEEASSSVCTYAAYPNGRTAFQTKWKRTKT